MKMKMKMYNLSNSIPEGMFALRPKMEFAKVLRINSVSFWRLSQNATISKCEHIFSNTDWPLHSWEPILAFKSRASAQLQTTKKALHDIVPRNNLDSAAIGTQIEQTNEWWTQTTSSTQQGWKNGRIADLEMNPTLSTLRGGDLIFRYSHRRMN